jgi:hypothetical protein
MAEAILEEAATGSITLYFDLEPDHKADLETVARTALAFAAVVRSVATHIDLASEIRIELESGTEGSLGLNAVVRWVKGFGEKHPTLVGIVMGAMGIILADARGWSVGQVLDYLTGSDAPPIAKTLSDEDLKRLAGQIAEYLKHPIAEQHRRQIYEEVQRDPSIKGLGTSGVPGKRPEIIIPRSEFPRLAGPQALVEQAPETRIVDREVTLTLIRPRLKAEVASWRFQQGTMPEFSAEMKDRDFLDAMAAGRLPLQLQIGIEMKAILSSEEHFEGGVWVAKKRSVTKVLSPRPTPPPSLFDQKE